MAIAPWVKKERINMQPYGMPRVDYFQGQGFGAIDRKQFLKIRSLIRK